MLVCWNNKMLAMDWGKIQAASLMWGAGEGTLHIRSKNICIVQSKVCASLLNQSSCSNFHPRPETNFHTPCSSVNPRAREIP